MGFGMSFHFQNVVLFRNVFSFSKCERVREYFSPFSKKHNFKQKFVNKNLQTKICKQKFVNKSLDEVVKKTMKYIH